MKEVWTLDSDLILIDLKNGSWFLDEKDYPLYILTVFYNKPNDLGEEIIQGKENE